MTPRHTDAAIACIFAALGVIFDVSLKRERSSGPGEVRAMDDFGEGKRFLYEEYGPGARDQRLELFAQGGWADRAGG